MDSRSRPAHPGPSGADPSGGAASSSTAIHRQVERLRRGEEPGLIARMLSGWAVMGARQVVSGYCLLLPDPVVPSLNDLAGPARAAFLDDMVRLGDAVLAATRCARINYEILGNLEPALHAHVIPRRTSEPDDLRTRPVWFFDWSAAPAFDPSTDSELVADIRARLGSPGRP